MSNEYFRDSEGKRYTLETNGNRQYLRADSGKILYNSDGKGTYRGNTADKVGDGNILTSLLSSLLG